MRTALLSIAVCAAVIPAWGESPATQAQIRLDYYLRHPDARYFELTLEAAAEASSDPMARGLLRDAFVKRFLEGRGPEGLSIWEFASLAEVAAPFGPGDAALIELLAGPELPAHWLESSFRRFLRGRFESAGSAVAAGRLLDAGWPRRPAEALDRYAFLSEILPRARREQVRERFVRERLAEAAPADMEEYHRRLGTLRGLGLSRFRANGEAGVLLGLLGDRLYRLPVAQWPLAGKSLESLVKSSGRPALDFFTRASGALRETPASRDAASGAMLATLAGLSDPLAAFAGLAPGHDADWFIWLHGAGVLPELRKRAPEILLASYELLEGFTDAPFPALFPEVLRHYYGEPALGGRPFAEILRPLARGPHAERLLSAAQRGEFFTAADRETLARDVLAAGPPLSPSWRRLGAPSRLALAVAVYGGLTPPAASASTLTDHLERPLLDELVDRFLELLRREPAPEDAILEHLEPLAAHLDQCYRRGAPTSQSPPLLRLESEMSADLDRVLETLPTAAPAQAVLLPEHEAALTRFIDRLRLTLRVRALVKKALGRPPEWLPRLRRGLRQRVFGLDAARSAATVYWEAALTRFRARLLLRLDDPLRTLLAGPANAAEADLFFEEIYVPLVRVHGLLRQLADEAGGVPPHLLWTSASDPGRNRARLEACFAALATDRWVDADAVVLELARRHLSALHPGRGAWAVPPGEVFAGHWGVNAHLGIYRELLRESPADAGGSLPAIAARVVEELEQRRRPVGPRFPIAGEVPAADRLGDLDVDAAWAENLITAAEWRTSPFLDAAGRVLPWQERVRPSFDEGAPFRLELRGNEAARRVDGRLRLRFGRLLLAGSGEPAALESAALFLPNHADNLAPEAGGPAGYGRFRQEIYGRLAAELENERREGGDLRRGAELLRRMMRLHVAQRSGPQLAPGFEPLFAGLRDLARGRDDVERALDHLRMEQSELERILGSDAGLDVETARAWVDDNLPRLLPPGWSAGNASLLGMFFRRELRALDEERIFWFLRLRRQLRVVAAGSAGAEEDPRDLERLRRALELADANIWYSRPDFEPERYLEILREDPDRWWPALVILAWYDNDLEERTLAALDSATVSSGGGSELETVVKRRVLQLNEAVFATLRALAEHPEGERMLAFEHRIPMRMLDLRLLAEALVWEEASATVLAHNGFAGMSTSFDLVRRSRPPSDDELWQRLFVSLDFALPEEERRAVDLSVNVDALARLADVWSRKPGISARLTEAAGFYAAASAARAGRLLAGAASPRGVMRAFHEIFDRTAGAAHLPGYVDFYLGALTAGPKRLSPELEAALSGPFFRNGEASAQMEEITALLEGWQTWSSGASPLGPAYRHDFDRVLHGLIRGEGRPEVETPYIWAPVEALAAEDGPLPDRPAAFLAVARWLLGLQPRYPEPELAALFALGDRP